MPSDEVPVLRIPGPTPLPKSVRDVLSRQMIDHRGLEYGELQRHVLANVRHFFQTDSDVLLFSCSGTGGLEAAIANTLSPGDAVLAVSIGVFGDRFAAIAGAFGLDVRRYSEPQGAAATQQGLADALEQHKGVKAVLITCNETSTGAANHMGSLATVIQDLAPNALVLADAVSAMGAIDIPMDSLGLDVVISGSQKAWMSPPGIALIGVSPRAWQAHVAARLPRFYFDFTAQRRAQHKHMDAWTPAMTTIFGLHEALELMMREGRQAIFARHERIAAITREKLQTAGLTLFAKEHCRSQTVTSATVPTGLDGRALLRYVREHYGITIGGGQGTLEGKIVRIGHMGWVEESHVDAAVGALANAIELAPRLVPPRPGPIEAHVVGQA